jgi:hypothetical protein
MSPVCRDPYVEMQQRRADAFGLGALLWALVIGDDCDDGERFRPEVGALDPPPDHPLAPIVAGLVERTLRKVTPFERVCARIEEIGAPFPEFAAYRQRIQAPPGTPELGSVDAFARLAVNLAPDTMGVVGERLFAKLGKPRVAASYRHAATAFARKPR